MIEILEDKFGYIMAYVKWDRNEIVNYKAVRFEVIIAIVKPTQFVLQHCENNHVMYTFPYIVYI